MPRIHEQADRERWRYKCPECRSEDWRVHDGTFGCRRCGETLDELIDAKTGETVHRREFEFIGPNADHKGEFGGWG
jgi:ribosomal protein L37AE/L43A